MSLFGISTLNGEAFDSVLFHPGMGGDVAVTHLSPLLRKSFGRNRLKACMKFQALPCVPVLRKTRCNAADHSGADYPVRRRTL